MNKKLLFKFIHVFPLLFFALLTYLISRKLIGGIVSTGDFPYFWPFSNVSSFSAWSTSYLGYDRASAMSGLQILTFIPKIFSKLGFSNESASYIHNYGLVYLCSLLYFLL